MLLGAAAAGDRAIEVLCDIPTAPRSEILPILDKYAEAFDR